MEVYLNKRHGSFTIYEKPDDNDNIIDSSRKKIITCEVGDFEFLLKKGCGPNSEFAYSYFPRQSTLGYYKLPISEKLVGDYIEKI